MIAAGAAMRLAVVRPDGTDHVDLSTDPAVAVIAQILARDLPLAKRLGIIAPTRARVLHAWAACLRAGRVPVLLQYPTGKITGAYWRQEIRAIAQTLAIDAVLYDDPAHDPGISAPSLCLRRLTQEANIEVSSDWLPAASEVMQLSSGTTGQRKGIRFTATAIRRHVADYNATLGLRADDHVVSWLPIYHDMGFVASFLMPLLCGARVTLIDPMDWIAQPEWLFEVIGAEGGTTAFMPNFAFELVARRAGPAAPGLLRTMRRWIACAEPTRPATIARFCAATATPEDRISSCYAMAENLFAVTQRDGLRVIERDGQQVISCGRPIRDVDIKIVDGEVMVRSPYSIESYLGGDDIRTLDGFYATGDLGTIVDGDLFILGRKHDVLNHSGRKFLLSDLDLRLAASSGGKAGRSAVVALADARLGTDIPACLIEDSEFWRANRDRQRIEAVRQAVGIDAARVEFVPPRFITKTSSGKINRRRTAEDFAAVLTARQSSVVAGDTQGLRARVAADYPSLADDVAVEDLLDSLGQINLALLFEEHGAHLDAEKSLAENFDALTTERNQSGQVIRIVSLCDQELHSRIFTGHKDLRFLSDRLGVAVQLSYVCAPPLPVLLSDLVFADYFMPRDDRPDVYAPVRAAMRRIREASLLLCDDLVQVEWPLHGVAAYPYFSHEFQDDADSPYVWVRWTNWSQQNHRIATKTVKGAELPARVNGAAIALSEYLGIPILRCAHLRKHAALTQNWEVAGFLESNDYIGSAAIAMNPDAFLAELTEAIAAKFSPSILRPGDASGNSYDSLDQPHWCGGLAPAAQVEFVLENFAHIVVHGRPGSIPRLVRGAEAMGKQIEFRNDQVVPDWCDCVVLNGAWRFPATDKPIIMFGPATPTHPEYAAYNLPEPLSTRWRAIGGR